MHVLALLAMAWGLSLPLRDVLAYPDRISVLPESADRRAAYHAIAVRLADDRQPRGAAAAASAGLGRRCSPRSTRSPARRMSPASWCPGPRSSRRWPCAWYWRGRSSVPRRWIAALVCAWSPALRGYVGTVQYEVVTGAALLAVLVLGLRTADADVARGALPTRRRDRRCRRAPDPHPRNVRDHRSARGAVDGASPAAASRLARADVPRAQSLTPCRSRPLSSGPAFSHTATTG